MELQKYKFCYLDQLKILKVLGTGYHAHVQLGVDEQGNKFAIKRYKKQTASLATLQHQLSIMKALKHQNIIGLVDVRENAVYKKNDGTSSSCFAIIVQYIGGGELFDFIAETGYFSSKMARTYFQQMMNGLHYMHEKGYAHRDLKPQNILIGESYTLKIADFGFSCMLCGRDGSYVLRTKLGTEGYMAPQIHMKNYDGTKTDIFAAGVILFVMYTGNPPFRRAASNDQYYKLIRQKKINSFWKFQQKYRTPGFFSQEFKDLFIKMVAVNPKQRPTMAQIVLHPWVKGQTCTKQQLQKQFFERTLKLQESLQLKRKQQEQKRAKNYEVYQNRGQSLQLQDMQFLDLLQSEQQKQRKLPILQPQNPEDFIVNENLAYAVALLKNFLSHDRIRVVDQNEAVGVQYETFEPKGFIEEQNKLTAKFELKYEIEKQMLIQECQMQIVYGINKKEQFVICFNLLEGDCFYFKKIAKEIKKKFQYCLI